MRSDEELYMLHYYLEKGHSMKELLSLSFMEKMFMLASMELTGEEMDKAYGEQKH